jgi:hypothetical protein
MVFICTCRILYGIINAEKVDVSTYFVNNLCVCVCVVCMYVCMVYIYLMCMDTGWFGARVQCLRRLLIRSFGALKYFFPHITHRFRITFLRWCLFITVIANFYKWGTVCFSITCHWFPCLLWKNRKVLPFVAFFNCHFRVHLEYFSLHMTRTWQHTRCTTSPLW